MIRRKLEDILYMFRSNRFICQQSVFRHFVYFDFMFCWFDFIHVNLYSSIRFDLSLSHRALAQMIPLLYSAKAMTVMQRKKMAKAPPRMRTPECSWIHSSKEVGRRRSTPMTPSAGRVVHTEVLWRGRYRKENKVHELVQEEAPREIPLEGKLELSAIAFFFFPAPGMVLDDY